MERNALIAIVLSVIVLIAFQYLTPKPPPQAPGEIAREAPAEEATTGAPKTAPAVPETPAETTPEVIEEELVTVDTSLYTATFSSLGGTVRSWILKKYRDNLGEGLSLLDNPDRLYPPLAIGHKGDYSASRLGFEVRGGDLRLDQDRNTGTLVFNYEDKGVSIKRTYTFYNDSYRFDIEDEVEGLPGYEITLGSEFGIADLESGGRYAHVGPVVLQDLDREEINTKKLQEPRSFSGIVKWIAVEDKYFFSALVPETPDEVAWVWKLRDDVLVALRAEAGTHKYIAYAGPKEHDRLEELGAGLEHVVDFGFFSIIARPIFWLLKKFYALVGNYGWAIVILTLVVRIPFIPLVNKGQKSMKKLQELQPRMQEVREKYKKDPKRMQEETMALYKKHKVNPVGGCLPMLLQIPVFFALYKVLLISIELRNAPWALWITDLSAKDPFYVLPIVMGVSMVVQQKMTPTGGDPKQQKMMMFMPVIFTFLFLNFASGLVLYWLVNNLLSIGQQVYVNLKKDKE